MSRSEDILLFVSGWRLEAVCQQPPRRSTPIPTSGPRAHVGRDRRVREHGGRHQHPGGVRACPDPGAWSRGSPGLLGCTKSGWSIFIQFYV